MPCSRAQPGPSAPPGDLVPTTTCVLSSRRAVTPGTYAVIAHNLVSSTGRRERGAPWSRCVRGRATRPSEAGRGRPPTCCARAAQALRTAPPRPQAPARILTPFQHLRSLELSLLPSTPLVFAVSVRLRTLNHFQGFEPTCYARQRPALSPYTKRSTSVRDIMGSSVVCETSTIPVMYVFRTLWDGSCPL